MRKEKSIGWYLVLYISLLITFIILSLVIYFNKYMVNNARDLDSNIRMTITSLMSNAYSRMEKDNSFSEISDISDALIKNGILSYISVEDKATNKELWSKKSSSYSKETENLKISQIKRETPHYIITTGYVLGAMQTGNIQMVLFNTRIFVLVFLLLGFIVSVLISNIVSKPITKLIGGVKEFSKGDFNHQLKETKLYELNELVVAYNEMAKQLKELYESLETKVRERTIALEDANKQLKETQAMMVHSEKMRSLGQLVAGIAHEINNPINFIYGNIIHLERYSNDLINLIDLYTKTEDAIPEDKRKEIDRIKKEIDLEFLHDDIADLIKSCKEGTERTKNIVQDLKNFSRLEEMVLSDFDVPKEIETTLNILHNKIKNRVTIYKNYEENLPKIPAYGGQLNQVFMNILDNAQYAVGDSGEIYIDVTKDNENIIIKFRDNGKGISPENLKKIFDPFFTTKPVGEGTGLGMSIAYKVIKNHNGDISVESTEGEGTTFTIKLPIKNKEVENGKV